MFDSCDFVTIARDILNNNILSVNSEKYIICEIEFYLWNEIHPDHYTHKSHDQTLTNTWYFHKYKTGTYKSGKEHTKEWTLYLEIVVLILVY